MSNPELCKYYLNLTPTTAMMEEVSFFDIITALDKHFNKQWTWELADERFAKDNSVVCTTVTVYIPGRILTGRSLCKIQDYHEVHLRAILNACSTFITKKMTVTNNETKQQEVKQMTPEEIMNMVQGQQPSTLPVNSASQFYNYEDNQGLPNQGVPFDQITENCHQELTNQIDSSTNQSTPDSIGYDEPNPKLRGFTQHQIDRLNKLKQDLGISSDHMFGNYVHTWNATLSKKSDITPDNVEAFLDWAEIIAKNQ